MAIPTRYKDVVYANGYSISHVRTSDNIAVWRGDAVAYVMPAFSFFIEDLRIDVDNVDSRTTQPNAIAAIRSAYVEEPMPTTGTVYFDVRNSETAAFIVGAACEINGYTATTDTSGRATFSNITLGVTYNAVVQAAGYETMGPWLFTPTSDGEVTNVNLVPVAEPPPPEEKGSFTVHVYDLDTAAAIAGASVNVDGVVQTTDTSGNTTFADKGLNTTYMIIVSVTGYYTSTPTHLFTSSGQTFNIGLVPSIEPVVETGTINVNVKDGETGLPISNATVSVGEFRRTTDGLGNAVFSDVPLYHAYTVYAAMYNYDISGESILFNVDPTSVTIVLYPITVLDPAVPPEQPTGPVETDLLSWIKNPITNSVNYLWGLVSPKIDDSKNAINTTIGAAENFLNNAITTAMSAITLPLTVVNNIAGTVVEFLTQPIIDAIDGWRSGIEKEEAEGTW